MAVRLFRRLSDTLTRSKTGTADQTSTSTAAAAEQLQPNAENPTTFGNVSTVSVLKELPTLTSLLDRLLYDNQRYYHPQVGRNMANHYSMGLVALHGIGGGDDHLQHYHNTHGPDRMRLQPPPRDADVEAWITTSNWADFLGDGRYIHAYKAFFAREIQRLGRQKMLAKYLSYMAPSVCKGLFHPVIRVSFALMMPQDAELVEGLTYFAIRYEPLFEGAEDELVQMAERWENAEKGSSKLGMNEFVSQTLQSLSEKYSHIAKAPGSTLNKLPAIVSTEDFRHTATSTLPSCSAEELLSACCGLASELYLATPALTTVHAVTGAQAVVAVLGYVEGEKARRMYVLCLWLWLAALWVEKGCRNLPDDADVGSRGVSTPNEERWTVLKNKAAKTNETHLIKLTFSAWVLDQTPSLRHCNNLAMAQRMVDVGKAW